MQVGHCVVLTIAQSGHERIRIEESVEQIHHIGLDIARLLQQFFGECPHEFFRLHHYGSIHAHRLPQVTLGVVVQRQCSHGQPNNFVAILVDTLGEVCVALVQIILFEEVIDVSSNVVFSNCPVDIAHHQLIIAGIQIDFCFNAASLQLVYDLVDTEIQM